MWLVNTSSLRAKEFFTEIPPYATLSHTWGDKEVTFQEFRKRKKSIRKKPGYQKVVKAAEQAARDGYEWLWADTSCIDKRSSAELSEAINSMYRWYERCEVCYAYLSDVVIGEDIRAEGSSFRNSRWFTRGWTLQELIAPHDVVFYDVSWTRLGSKMEMNDFLEEITGIDKTVLVEQNYEEFSVAQRMSWASRRKTTRPEDMAYCLFGLFNINLPPLYGEGEKAFVRLQAEIVKWTDDHSIFAWPGSYKQARAWEVLAPSPSFFEGARNILSEWFDHKDDASSSEDDKYLEDHESHPFAMVNSGLQITLPVRCVDSKSGLWEAALECTMDKVPCSCGQAIDSEDEHHSECQSLWSNNRAIIEMERVEGTVRAFRRLSLIFGPVNDEFEKQTIFLW